jgi:hypothetical protein
LYVRGILLASGNDSRLALDSLYSIGNEPTVSLIPEVVAGRAVSGTSTHDEDHDNDCNDRATRKRKVARPEHPWLLERLIGRRGDSG